MASASLESSAKSRFSKTPESKVKTNDREVSFSYDDSDDEEEKSTDVNAELFPDMMPNQIQMERLLSMLERLVAIEKVAERLKAK